MFNFVNNKNIIFIIFLIIFLLGVYFFIVKSNVDFENTKTIEEICGEYPLDFVKIDIEKNLNHIFINDPKFLTKQLYDFEGNALFVNSFIECEYFTSIGWDYSPKNNETFKREKCEEFENLQSTALSNIRFVLIDIKLNQFYKDYSINCLGKLRSKYFSNEQEFYEVYYSRSLYIAISQLLPLGIMIFSKVKMISKNFLFICLVILLIYSQVIFSKNYSFNYINNVSFFSGLMLLVYLYNPKNEIDAKNSSPKIKFPKLKKFLKRNF